MKFTLNLLKEFLEIHNRDQEEKVISALTSLGLEVESVEDKAKKYQGFITAEIISAVKHPDADSLRVCQVSDGKNQMQIVCGAANARAGIKVILATIGAIVPNGGFAIKKSLIRGQESNGMLCSGSELELSSDGEGIVELPLETKNGISLAEALKMDDKLIEISITPNRGDCLGVYGIARDLAAKNIGTLKQLNPQAAKEEFTSSIKIDLTEYSGCSRAIFRQVKNINNSKTPEFLSKTLESIGQKPISFAVDLTNYSTFIYGRPMHAFDADLIQGNMIIRKAQKDEKFLALNDSEIELVGDEIVIADDQGVIAMAGVIGGKRTACHAETKNILLEIAVFDPVAVAKAGRAHNIITDSRFRFERGVDGNFLETADAIVTEIIKNHCPEASFSNIIFLGNKNSQEKIVEYKLDDFIERAGFKLNLQQIKDILLALGFKIEGKEEMLVTVPSWRHDVSGPDDLTEEVLRVYGYDNVPMKALSTLDNLAVNLVPLSKKRAKHITMLMASFGYNELVTWSFLSDKKASLFSSELNKNLYIQNPISEELNYMRSSIIPNLLDAAKHNINRGVNNLSFFEIGPLFLGHQPGEQRNSCSAIRFGNKMEKNIFSGKVEFDIFDIKTDLMQLIDSMGFDSERLIIDQTSAPNFYNPSQSAVIKIGKNILGHFGKIHPMVLKKFDLNDNCYGFELFYDELPAPKNKKGKRDAYQPNPLNSIRRDFAFLLDRDFPVGKLTKIIENVDKKHIDQVNIFDIYAGDKIDANKKSVALAVHMTPLERSFTDSEIEAICQKIINAIEQEANAILRN